MRTITWDGCLNVRDLGGHPTAAGRPTRHGAVVRADSVRRLSDDGWRQLVDYGVRTIVDLRFHEELDADPPRELPVDVVHVSLFGVPDRERWDDLDRRAAAAGDAAASTRFVYLEQLEEHRAEVAAVMRHIADAPEGTVLVHCQAGKDRTGLVTALLLRLAEVAPETVADDYAESADNLAPMLEEWIGQADDQDERERRRRISASPAEGMLGVLEELDRRYGGVAGYLLSCGLEPETLERLRDRLRG